MQEAIFGGARVQELTTSGEFVRMFGGDVISDGASGTGNLTVGSATVSAVETDSRFFEVGQMVTGAGIPTGTTITAVGPGTMTLSKAATSTASGVPIEAPAGVGNVAANKRLTFAIEGSNQGEEPTGGTFKLGFSTPDPSPSEATTAGLPLEASAAELEAALAALPNLDAADVDVTGSPGGPWTVEFVGSRFGNSAPPRLNVDTRELTPQLPSFENFAYGGTIAEETAPEVCNDAPSCRVGVPGVGPGEFSSGTLYFTEAARGTLTPILAAGSGIVGTADGIAVADHQRVQKFALDGSHQHDLAIPGKTPSALAATPAGDLWTYLNLDKTPGTESKAVPAAIELDGVTGLQLAEIPLGEERRGLATDASGNLYAGWAPARSDSGFEPGRVNQYGANLQPLNPASCCLEPPLGAGSKGRYSLQSAMVVNSVGDLLVTYGGETGVDGPPIRLKLFGPAPVRLEAPPAIPPTIASQFASSVQSREAIVSGLVNPHFWTNTKVYVEYGIGSCSAGECTQRKPLPPGELLTAKSTGSLVKAPGVILEGLMPNTMYHYRLVAESSGGGPVIGVGGTPGSPGGEGAFTTASARSEGQAACPNSAFRTGFSAPLPDCRAYEMVSPVDKDGGDVKTLLNFRSFSNALDQSAEGGDAFTFSSYRTFGESAGAPMTAQYMAVREGSGWETTPITPPQALNSSGPGYQTGVNFDNMYRAFSPDLCAAWVFVETEPALAPGADEDLPALYRRENCSGTGSYETLAQAEAEEQDGGGAEVELQGVSADGTAMVVRSFNNLIPEAGGGAKSRAYYVSHGQTALVCMLPDGSRFEGDCTAGSSPLLSSYVAEGEGNRAGTLTHAISADGSRVYWTAIVNKEGEPEGFGKIYLRENPGAEQSASGGCDEAGKACTLKVSETRSTARARFLAASADGSKALYVFDEGTQDGNLFEFDADEGASRLVARKSLGYVAGAEDLSIFYFVSEEKLAGTTGATSGEPNLYVTEDGSTTFIATLSRLDANPNPRLLSDVSPWAALHIARATPDGRTLAFLSTKSLTGYDNTDAASRLPCGVREGSEEGLCDAEVYLYRAGSESPVCVSCNPTGAQPEGRDGLKVGEQRVPYVIAGNLTAPTTQHYTPRNLSVDGNRLFFDSYDSLLPRDTNGRKDVYQWEAASGAGQCEAIGAEIYVASSGGCLSLISSGESPEDSEFIDADPDGANVFFLTNASLLPQDPGLFDVYDARVEGGFSQPVVPVRLRRRSLPGTGNPADRPDAGQLELQRPRERQAEELRAQTQAQKTQASAREEEEAQSRPQGQTGPPPGSEAGMTVGDFNHF